MSERRRLGALVDEEGRPRVCLLCDRAAVIRWQGEDLCRWHFDADSRHREAVASAKRCSARSDPRLGAQSE